MLLALDTSTPHVSVALRSGGAVVAAARSERPMQHGEQLAPLVARCLAEAGADRRGLTGVAVGVGPGPYTGLRVGLVTARTLGLVLGVPVRGAGSLDAVAVAAAAGGVDEPFLVTLDARRRELFWASYDGAGRRLEGPRVDRPADLPQDRLVVGPGVALHPFPRSGDPAGPDAGWLARAVEEGLVEVVEPEPVYLRRPDAAVPGRRKAVT